MPLSATILLRELFNGLRWLVRAGCPCRMIPHDLAPWQAIHQQTMRWTKAGCFEAMVRDLRAIRRLLHPWRCWGFAAIPRERIQLCRASQNDGRTRGRIERLPLDLRG